LARGDCKPGDPAGHFEGTAVSREAGSLNLSLDLRCVNGKFEGELSTPVGTYIVKDGSVSANQLRLHLEVGNDSADVEMQVTTDALRGRFTSGTDSGPVELHRAAETRKAPVVAISGLTAAQWREDIQFLGQELPKRHANAFHTTPRAKFEAEIAAVDQQAGQLNADQMYVALDRVVNSIGDGHTFINFPEDKAAFPLEMLRFGDEYRIVAVGKGLEKALGARVIRIDKTWIDEARQLALTLAPIAETDALADARAAGFLTMGITLHGLDIIADPNVAHFTMVQDQGEPFTLDVHAAAPDSEIDWVPLVKNPPLSRQLADEHFWVTYLADSRALYCNFRGYDELQKNAAALFAEIKKQNPQKLIIDLRQNGGGNFDLGLKYLIKPIQNLPSLNRKGHLFILIGVNTFSAAMSNAAQFRTMTNGILAGEPIGERPNSYQEVREMKLPNSGLVVRYSTKYYTFVEGKENLVRPDQEIHTTWDDYRSGRDPVLEWVLSYK
jgi:hypothetical protein